MSTIPCYIADVQYVNQTEQVRQGKRLLSKQSPTLLDYGYQQKSSVNELLLFTFSLNNYKACYKNVSDPDRDWELVIVVVSDASHFMKRHAIRNTWGSELRTLNSNLVFLVGINGDDAIEKQIQKEFELYNDVVQVDIADQYRNLTRKSIAMLQWLTDYCHNSRYYLKADDDMYVNIRNVIHELKGRREQRFFLCHVFRKAPPIRQKSSKWFISYDEFTGEFFPTYCSGTAYAYSSSILSNLHQSAVQKVLVSLEDVYITGVAAEGINVSHVHCGKFSYYKQKPTGCTFEKLLAGHEVTIEEMFIIHSQIQSREYDCDTNQNKYITKVENEY